MKTFSCGPVLPFGLLLELGGTSVLPTLFRTKSKPQLCASSYPEHQINVCILFVLTARRGAERGSSPSQACGWNYLPSSRSQEYCGQDCQLRSQVMDTAVGSQFQGFSCFSSLLLVAVQLWKLKEVPVLWEGSSPVW